MERIPDKRTIITDYTEYLNTKDDKDDIINTVKEQLQQAKQFDFTSNKKPGKKFNKLYKDNIDIHNLEYCGYCMPFNCHFNADFIERKYGYPWYFGYQLFSCDCGNIVSAECHSVNKVGDKFVDFTRDYDNNTDKSYINLGKCQNKNGYIQHIMEDFGALKVPIGVCKCKNIKWNEDERTVKLTKESLVPFIIDIEIRVAHSNKWLNL